MFRRIFSILIITIFLESCHATVNITCTFAIDDGKYTAKIYNQMFTSTERGVKIYGRHAFHKKNLDVEELDGSFGGNQLEIIPPVLLQIFSNLKSLKLEKCGIKKLTSSSFKYCGKIESMKFGSDKIVDIEPAVFKMCRNLKVLEFNGNQFDNLNSFAFNGLDNLEVLKMDDCHIHTIEIELLIPLGNLVELHITGNAIKELPTMAIQGMDSLKVMNFSNNKLETFATVCLKDKNHLEVVDLSKNAINSLERDFLEDWPNNAALNIESNECIDKNFGPIGTFDQPLFDIIEFFMDCFNDEKKSTTKRDSTIEASKPASSEESESAESTTVVAEKVDEEIKISDVDSQLTSPKTDDDENVENMTDSPFDFAKEPAETTENEEKVEATSATPIKAESSESLESDESEEMTTTEPSTTTTEETTTTEPPTEPPTKKHKKKKKSKKSKTTAEPINTLEPETAIAEENIEEDEATDMNVAESTIEETTEPTVESSTTYLHDYEQATCRFYVDSDGNYNCELVNVTNYLKKINTPHFDGYENDNVTGVYFRFSKLFHVPKVVVHTFTNIDLLSIERTNLKVMDNEFLEDCGRIKRINLKDNKIRRVERNSLRKCMFLEHVDLSRNPIETVEGGVFECSPKVSFTFNQLNILSAHTKSTDNLSDEY